MIAIRFRVFMHQVFILKIRSVQLVGRAYKHMSVSVYVFVDSLVHTLIVMRSTITIRQCSWSSFSFFLQWENACNKWKEDFFIANVLRMHHECRAKVYVTVLHSHSRSFSLDNARCSIKIGLNNYELDFVVNETTMKCLIIFPMIECWVDAVVFITMDVCNHFRSFTFR